jgi:hypothetical protein
MMLGLVLAAATPALTPSPAPTLILWLTVVGIIAAGGVVVAGRYSLKHGQDGTAASLIRSWIAISLVIGLLVFCAATLLGNNMPLQSTLFGGLIASTGAAVAFYFSSRQADQARADMLNMAASSGQGASKPNIFSSPKPPDSRVDDTYNHRFAADGFPAPTYGVASGGPPPGLTLDPDGILHGQPTTTGSFTFKVTAANYAGFLVSPDLTVTIS